MSAQDRAQQRARESASSQGAKAEQQLGGHLDSFDFVFVTSKYPIPADDGQKIPVAGLVEAVRTHGGASEILIAEPPSETLRLADRAALLTKRFNPFAGFASSAQLPASWPDAAPKGKTRVYVVSPARLLDLIVATPGRSNAKIVLILNDAKWPMYLEALEYGIGLRRGGTMKDLLKGAFLPLAFVKERFAYRCADIILVQTTREKGHLRRYADKLIVAPNAIPCPAHRWSGQESNTLAMQINFTNRRANKWQPFVRDIWPEIRARHPQLRLELFGPGETPPPWAAPSDGLDYIGCVDDLDAYLAEKRALIMPLEHSTGISNTVLRGLALGMPTVITKSASFGVKDIVRAHDPVFIAQKPNDLTGATLEAIAVQIETEPRAIHDWSENLLAILESLLPT